MPITKETNCTLTVVALVTTLALVSFRPKTNIPNYILQSETKGSTWNRHSSHVVVTPINRVWGRWFLVKTNRTPAVRSSDFVNPYDRNELRAVQLPLLIIYGVILRTRRRFLHFCLLIKDPNMIMDMLNVRKFFK